MEEKIIEAINTITQDKRLNRKQVYEHLLSAGVVKPNTENMVYDIIERALHEGYIPRRQIITYRKKSGKLPEIFTREQLIRIFDTVDRPKLAVAMWLGLFCGMRIREVCNLKVSDLDLENKRIFIRDSKNKNRSKQGYGKDRVTNLPDIAISPLKKWLDIVKGGTWFLPSMQSPDTPLRTKTVHEQYRQLLNTCGLSEAEATTHYTAKNHNKKKPMKKTTYKYRFHTLRHTYATYLLEKGVPLENIQRALGHQQLDTTLIYAKVRDTKTRQFINDAFNDTTRLVRNKPAAQAPIQHQETQKGITADEILKQRLARGEIDLVTYKRLFAEINPENTLNVIHTMNQD